MQKINRKPQKISIKYESMKRIQTRALLCLVIVMLGNIVNMKKQSRAENWEKILNLKFFSLHTHDVALIS